MRGHPQTKQSRKTAARKRKQIQAITQALLAKVARPKVAIPGPHAAFIPPANPLTTILATLGVGPSLRRI